MKEKYNATPGPWKQSPGFMIEGANGDYVCRVDASEGKSHFANAQLIASAPELFGALEMVEQVFNVATIDSMKAFMAIEKVRAVLAKAKGGA